MVNDLRSDTSDSSMIRRDGPETREIVEIVARRRRRREALNVTYLCNHAHVGESRMWLRMVLMDSTKKDEIVPELRGMEEFGECAKVAGWKSSE